MPFGQKGSIIFKMTTERSKRTTESSRFLRRSRLYLCVNLRFIREEREKRKPTKKKKKENSRTAVTHWVTTQIQNKKKIEKKWVAKWNDSFFVRKHKIPNPKIHTAHIYFCSTPRRERNSDYSNLVYERLTKYHLYIYTIYKIAMENKLNEISVLSMKSRSWRSPSMKCRFKIETDALK